MTFDASEDQEECKLLHELHESTDLLDQVLSSDRHASDLNFQKQLRASYSPALVRAALSLRDARRRAKTRFSRAAEMWFDPKGLEQSTTEPVAFYKAGRFTGAVADWCCGIGMDSIALAAQGCHVNSVDLKEANCIRTRWNADAYGVSASIDVRAANVRDLDRGGLVHIDPDRRPGNKRMMRVEDYEPGLDFLLDMIGSFDGGAIKLSPASNFGGKFIDGPIEVELISLNRECKEATIWFGDLAGENSFRATVLSTGRPKTDQQFATDTVTLTADPLSAWTDVRPLGQYIFDPDPSIVRAGLVDVLADRLGLWRLDDAEEYLSGDTWLASPFVQTFKIISNLPNNDKEIRRAFRTGSYGQVEVKCRHLPIDAEAVRRKLPLDGTEPVTLIYTRQAGKAKAVLATRMSD